MEGKAREQQGMFLKMGTGHSRFTPDCTLHRGGMGQAHVPSSGIPPPAPPPRTPPPLPTPRREVEGWWGSLGSRWNFHQDRSSSWPPCSPARERRLAGVWLPLRHPRVSDLQQEKCLKDHQTETELRERASVGEEDGKKEPLKGGSVISHLYNFQLEHLEAILFPGLSSAWRMEGSGCSLGRLGQRLLAGAGTVDSPSRRHEHRYVILAKAQRWGQRPGWRQSWWHPLSPPNPLVMDWIVFPQNPEVEALIPSVILFGGGL